MEELTRRTDFKIPEAHPGLKNYWTTIYEKLPLELLPRDILKHWGYQIGREDGRGPVYQSLYANCKKVGFLHKEECHLGDDIFDSTKHYTTTNTFLHSCIESLVAQGLVNQVAKILWRDYCALSQLFLPEEYDILVTVRRVFAVSPAARFIPQGQHRRPSKHGLISTQRGNTSRDIRTSRTSHIDTRKSKSIR